RRPEIGKISGLRLREIGVVQPVLGLLRTHVIQREPAALPQYAKRFAQHTYLVVEMVEGVLAADEVKAARCKRQRCAVAVYPGNLVHFAPCLVQHSERAVETDEAGVGRDAPVGDLLITGAAGDVEQRQARG